MHIRFIFVLLGTVTLLPLADGGPSRRGWNLRSHDERRTGRANVDGPHKGDRVWSYTAVDGVVINIEPTATRDGVFFGTWGVIRRDPANKKENWDKFDGKIYGFESRTGRELWPPLHPGRTPYAYDYGGRKPTEQDRPAGNGLHWNFYNGTVEGTPAYDPKSGLLYVGRGDGHLYAVDPKTGRKAWTFTTFDPATPNDPEGGGEIVGGPLVDPRSEAIIFATFAAPNRPDPPRLIRHETNAVYAIDRKGKLLWRYPGTGTLEQVFVAPPAFSLDLQTTYAVTTLPDGNDPCEFLAINVSTGRLKWRLSLADFGGNDLAVGADGIVYVTGMREGALGSHPVAFAIQDRASSGRIIWGPQAPEGQRPQTHFSGGIAIFEESGDVQRVYVTSTHTRNANGRGGRLHSLDPVNGDVRASWNPEDARPSTQGGLTDVTLDRSGIIYVGVRGRWQSILDPAQDGRIYALRHNTQAQTFSVLWSQAVDGQIDWASPAIGPDGGLYFGSSSELSPLLLGVARGNNENVANADPKFYGVHDRDRTRVTAPFEILSAVWDRSHNHLTLSWCAETTGSYTVQTSRSLHAWRDVTHVPATAGARLDIKIKLDVNESAAYFRVKKSDA